MKMIKRCAALLVSVLVLMGCFLTGVSATEGFDVNNCLVFATEPGGTSPYVAYYKDGEQQSTELMKWVDGGVRGKALSLDGQSEYLEIGYYQLRMAQMTFATWINFEGTADETNPAGHYWQRLFTIDAGDKCFFTVSPHAVDPALTNDDGQLDGVYMEYYRGYSAQNGQEYSMKAFTGATTGMSSFGLPQNEWHHMAVVVNNMSVQLYIDGNLILEEVFLMPIVQMSANSMKVGKGIWSDPTLHALLDDTMMFDKALTADQVKALMQTGDTGKLENAAAVVTTATDYLPTTVATTTVITQPTAQPEDKPDTPFGLPVWGFAVVMGLLALLIILTVVVNLYEASWRKAHAAPSPAPMTDVSGDDDDKPQLSIKEAAKQTRREEHERFLEEEEKERQEQEMPSDSETE